MYCYRYIILSSSLRFLLSPVHPSTILFLFFVYWVQSTNVRSCYHFANGVVLNAKHQFEKKVVMRFWRLFSMTIDCLLSVLQKIARTLWGWGRVPFQTRPSPPVLLTIKHRSDPKTPGEWMSVRASCCFFLVPLLFLLLLLHNPHAVGGGEAHLQHPRNKLRGKKQDQARFPPIWLLPLPLPETLESVSALPAPIASISAMGELEGGGRVGRGGEDAPVRVFAGDSPSHGECSREANGRRLLFYFCRS